MSKKVVITGAGGFLGGHLVEYFLSQGWEVIAVFHQESAESAIQTKKRCIQKEELFGRLHKDYRANLTEFDGDITNLEDIRRLFQKNQPDALIHAAALLIPPKETDYQDSAAFRQAVDRFIEINQAHILADCTAEYQTSNPHFYSLLVSTIFVFGTETPIINEALPHKPPHNSRYAISKDEAQQYWESLNLNLGVIFPPQIYGPYQFTPAIMPRLIRKLLFNEGGALTLNGAINPIHVTNLIQLMYALCHASAQGDYCVNGDGIMTLADIGDRLQSAANEYLAQHNHPSYSGTAFTKGSTSTTAISIDDSKLK